MRELQRQIDKSVQHKYLELYPHKYPGVKVGTITQEDMLREIRNFV